jgi:hypothetical protein
MCREITEQSSELRLLLCREKEANGKKSTNVVTACGIFVTDILDAAPIDKYFEMFKPGSGKEGGFVRLKMALLTEDDMRARQQGAHTHACALAALSSAELGLRMLSMSLLAACCTGVWYHDCRRGSVGCTNGHEAVLCSQRTEHYWTAHPVPHLTFPSACAAQESKQKGGPIKPLLALAVLAIAAAGGAIVVKKKKDETK